MSDRVDRARRGTRLRPYTVTYRCGKNGNNLRNIASSGRVPYSRDLERLGHLHLAAGLGAVPLDQGLAHLG